MTFGVYVHVPFCARRCDYCAFATWTDRHHLMPAYVRACVAEIDRADLPPATSVFFGGGTPSLLPAEGLVAILAAVPRAADAEVTVECNPEDVDDDLLAAYHAAGVTRVSLGVQSLDPAVLAALGRAHAAAAVTAAVAAVKRASFESFSVDLIFGAAGESLASWERTVDAALALEPPHISAYALTVEAGTALAADRGRHPDDDDQAEKYLLADAAFAASGRRNYEISNWARPGHRCRHNLLYWRQGEYRGIGCAAHSHRAGRRWWNVRTPARYISAIEAGRSPEAGAEQLGPEVAAGERLQLALRTSAGVPTTAFAAADLAALTAAGAIDSGPARVRLSPRGRLLANEVAARLRW